MNHGTRNMLMVARKDAGLSQAELAKRAGVSICTVNSIERGRVAPREETMRKIYEAIRAATYEKGRR